MAEAPYRIFGAELSPYSVKVRSYFRYKAIPHEWIPRNASNMDEFRRHAKLPLIPLVLAPDGAALQDSTPILERMEAAFPEPSIHPPEPVAAFVSALLEEYADEWGNKAMFHYRWTYEPDQASAAERIARENLPGADEATVRRTADAVRGRMVPRLSFVGSSAETRGVIEGSFEREVALLEAHLARRPYLFGARPAFADFGVFAQLYECLTDPTPGAYLRAKVPRTVAWIERMLAPKGEGPFEPWTALEPTLLPLLRDEVGGTFLPWSEANRRALEAGRDALEVELGGRPFRQQPQKYHARSLAALRARYTAARSDGLDALLARAGCLPGLRGGV
jgi:glutathione S-transferase